MCRHQLPQKSRCYSFQTHYSTSSRRFPQERVTEGSSWRVHQTPSRPLALLLQFIYLYIYKLMTINSLSWQINCWSERTMEYIWHSISSLLVMIIIVLEIPFYCSIQIFPVWIYRKWKMLLYKIRSLYIKVVREHVRNALGIMTFWGDRCHMFKWNLDKTISVQR